MKRYRYITLSLLLLLLSLSTLSAQETFQGADKDWNYQFEVKTTPSYCLNEGTMEIKLLIQFNGAPLRLSQIEQVEYEVKDKEGHSYTVGYKPAPAPTGALRIEQLPGRDDYRIFIRLIPKKEVNKSVVETNLLSDVKIENKYVALEETQVKFDAYRLPCRPYGSFHIVARGGTQRPPVLNIMQAPDAFTGTRTMQPTKREVKGDTTLYHFEYSGALPQGTYEYTLESDCRETTVKSFAVYGPTANLPTVPSDFKIPFDINIMSGEGCASNIIELGANFDKDKLGLRELFKEMNRGYQGDSESYFPEYVDSFPSTFIKNYEVAVVTQQEYAKLQQGTLDASTLLWSSQTGSLTKADANDSESGGVSISYRLPQSMSLQELRTQQALPAAVLIRVKRPNEGCNDYITIPITVDLDFHKNRFEILETEDASDCSIGQIIWFQGWNFCTLRFKYYELPDGSDKPDPSATPIHTSDDFGPAVSTSIDKRYTFAGYDPTKRYYVEVEGTDLYGNPITPKPSLILAPTNKKPIKNRLYDFSSIYAHLPQPMLDRIKLGSLTAYLSPGYHTYLFPFYGQSLNAMAGMEITLVEAPEGYEEYRRTCESYYFNTPNPTDAENPYGGGMIGLGEKIKMSNTFTGPGGTGTPEYFFPFRFIYKVGKNGERIVYPYKDNYSEPTPLKGIITRDPEKDAYLEKHPMPRGIYRLKFEHPCQPGESFYIDLDMSEPDFKPELTELIKPVVDRTSCDEVRVYPFADGRLDYAINKEGKPRNIIFYVTLAGGQKKWLYFYPKDRDGNPIDHTKFYIPVKSVDLPLTLNLRYFYPKPSWQWIKWDKPTSTSVNPIGGNQFVKGELERGNVGDGDYKLPLDGYNPNNDQDDWGEDGFSWSSWSAESFVPWISVDVPITREGLTPSYARPTYVGYRCSKETGYMEFKLINIPNKVGTVVLKDGDKVIISSNIEDLPEDLMVKWELDAESGSELKNEYRLEIKTSLCGETNMQTEKFTVKLEDISEGIAVTVSPQGAHCPGDMVTLTATNLGVPDSAYKWTFDNGDTDSGRTIRRKVSAPRVVDGKAHYESYTLTVNGTRCGTNTSKGTISVSPDELWWMPDLNGEGHATVPGGTDEEETPTDPNPSSSDAKYYDWHNPDNWVFLHEGKFYPAKAVPTRCTNVHIMNLSQFELGPVGSKLRAQPDLAKEVTPRDLYGEPTCIDITFHSGASVFNIQQLNYRRAMVRYNFGVADGTSYDSDRHIYTTEEVNTDEWMYGRDELNLLSAPLYDIYAGDYSFSASPYTYQLGFKAERAGKSMEAQFDASAFNDPSPLQSISMAGNNNCIALIVAKDTQGFNRKGSTQPVITQRRGILELPYFDRPDIANSFYHQTYDASTGQTRFQYFDGKSKRFRGYYSYAQRSKMAYRFIFEDPATQRIAKLADGTEGYTMAVSATAAGQEVMVGNPFMAPLRVVPFLEANEAVIEPYVRLLYPVDVKGYEPLKLDGSVNTYPQITAGDKKINPLGAFVVKLKSNVGSEAKLVFPTTALDSYAKQHPQSSSSLRNTSGDATAETARYLSLTLQSLLGKDRALVAYGYESGSVDKMLLSTESRYPSIAIIDPADGLHKDLYADDAATGHYELATRVSEPIDVTLSLAGSVMGHIVTARLIDHKSGLEHDLTGGKSCQIKLFPDDAEGRLELRVDGDFTSVAPMAAPTDELQAQYSEGMLTVRTTAEMSSLRLVQGDGITVYTQSLPGLTEYSERILLSSGSYVVEAIGTDGVARRATLVVR
ncbi:MAG: hypothetical protein JNG44_00335 [Porphyromonas sp.]|uniref:hypothetical protein n=1 Tax=Porphyromonas sp. TaxID=1924944 RepID=UPI001A37C4FA|nr:hypothetical protein [Porphyromonas sp.]MBL6452140.1 hypothetical protein [Porphyromonas sp.]